MTLLSSLSHCQCPFSLWGLLHSIATVIVTSVRFLHLDALIPIEFSFFQLSISKHISTDLAWMTLVISKGVNMRCDRAEWLDVRQAI